MSKGRIDFDGESWSAHRQSAWLDDAANARMPLALRVAFYAYANHKANGHARLAQGELARLLSRVVDGELLPADRRTVYRAIQQAIEYGFLAQESKALCLIVPGHRVQGGEGREDAPCDRHPRKGRRHLKAVS